MIFRPKAKSHEKAVERLESQHAKLAEKVSDDKAKTVTAIRVLTEETANLDTLLTRLGAR